MLGGNYSMRLAQNRIDFPDINSGANRQIVPSSRRRNGQIMSVQFGEMHINLTLRVENLTPFFERFFFAEFRSDFFEPVEFGLL